MKFSIKNYIKEILVKEMSGTGTGGSMSGGAGEQYGSVKAFKKKKSKVIPVVEKQLVDMLEYALKEKSLSITNSLFEYVKKKYKEEKFKLNESLLNAKKGLGEKRGENLQKVNMLRKLPMLLVDKNIAWYVKVNNYDISRLQLAVKQAIEAGEDIKNSSILRDAGFGPKIREAISKVIEGNKLNENKNPLERKLARLKREKQDNKKLSPEAIEKLNKQIKDTEDAIKLNKKEKLNETRYSQFKRESSTRNPSETLSKAIREIRKKVYGLKKVMEFASKMKTEFKQNNNVSEYNKRTNESLGKLSLEIKELRNYLGGLK